MRREIRKSVGQLTGGKGANTVPTNTIRNILKRAATFSEPSIDTRPYIIQPLPPTANDNNCRVSAMMIYQMNILAKAVISQFINEAGVAPKAADPAGVVAISLFANNEFRWQDMSLFDIFIAKYHVVCPVLFGIYGSDQTEQGRKRLGWWRDESGAWINDARNSERMTGLGAGFAAIALRDFSRSQMRNPYPPSNYWQAFANIVNVPKESVTQTHCIVLKAMIENNIPRFIGFYGQAAIAALRKALVDFPQQAPKSVASAALATLVPTIRRDLHLKL
ncbi:hypothetical protein MRB53_040409 [Persea americana]|nr:hypothetical protein MRB53_040409 [Persea americana]